jgi:hypothetical protein
MYRCDARKLNCPNQRVVLAGMLGAGILQFLLVASGFFPGWATGPPHLCALWWLTVLALAIWMSHQTSRLVPIFAMLAIAGMLGMQILYAGHCRQLLPRVNSSYIASERPQLVCLDNLARGFVLQLAEVMPGDQPVLATDGRSLRRRLLQGDFSQYDRILYLPMDETVAQEKPGTIDAARQAGFTVRELPVVHPLLYNAVIFQKGISTSDNADNERVVPR